LPWWLPARFSLDRWTISGNSCQGWSQRWPKNQGHSSEWSFHPDQKTYNVMEVYQNSDALVAHLKHVTSTDFLKELGQVRKTTNAIVFGSPDAQVKEALTRLDPVYTSHIDGFIR